MDIRTPIGLMFLVKGVLLTGYGAYTNASAIYDRSLGMNVNLYWGFLLILFGATMLALARRSSVNTPAT